MKVIFMGTPAFAVPSLLALMEKAEVVLVVTQPDKPKGRGQQMMFSPVKEVALSHNIPVLQPPKIRDGQVIEALRQYRADLIVVVAFGQILPKELLCMPPLGCINVHGSLLPKYRGAAPMQWAVINGEDQTGITTMYMAEGLDSGDMILKETLAITPEDTFGTIYEKMQDLGAKVLMKTVEIILDGTVTQEEQIHTDATLAPMITKETGHINWALPCENIINLIRGLDPAPTAYTIYDGTQLKIWKAEATRESFEGIPSGQIVSHSKKGFVVKAGDGGLLILEMQAKGGKRMTADAYLRGHDLPVGTMLS